MADQKTSSGHDVPVSVSALGLRWAALRGMLASPLIDAEDQRALKEELLRELQVIERDFAALPARNTVEMSAKIDVVKTVLRQSPEGQGWIVRLLESVQTDLRLADTKVAPRPERPALSRSFPARPEPSQPAAETDVAAVA
jgi:hypothetical protein